MAPHIYVPFTGSHRYQNCQLAGPCHVDARLNENENEKLTLLRVDCLAIQPSRNIKSYLLLAPAVSAMLLSERLNLR